MRQRVALGALLLLGARLAGGCGETAPESPELPRDAASDSQSDDAGTLEVNLPPRELACPPTDAAWSRVGWVHPPIVGHTAEARCASFDDVAFAVTCTTDPTSGGCDYPDFEACWKCLVQPADAGVRGPLIAEGSVLRLNTAGCVMRLGGAEAEPFARVLAEADDCTAWACASCAGRGSVDDYEQCLLAARSGACATLSSTASGLAERFLLPPDAAASECLSAGTFVLRAQQIGALFCVPPDAGPDASFDAADQ